MSEPVYARTLIVGDTIKDYAGNNMLPIQPRGVRWFVDGTNGSDSASGLNWSSAFKTIQAAITAASQFDEVVVAPKEITAGDSDPGSYTENLVIGPSQAFLKIVGAGNGRVQGGLPQLKVGTTTTQALLTIRAPGCIISGLGFNGAGATGGGILLDEVTSTGQAWGTVIENCHFKNCVGTTSTLATTGGAIQWSSAGGAWQVRIRGNRFYKNVGDVVLLGTSSSVPQDVVIEDNDFSGPAASVDCNLYLAGGSGMNGVVIKNNIFQQLPSLGATARYIVATGCVGMLVGNYFGCATNVSGTPKTFKVGGSAAEIPTTVHVVGNFGQSVTAAEAYGAIITIA